MAKPMISVAALLGLAVTPLLGDQEWMIDRAHSAAQFSVRHLMVSNVRGHFGKMTGKAIYDPSDPASAKVEAEVDVSSIDTREPKRDAHLKSPDFFDVEKYPTMTFRSAKVESLGEGKMNLIGELTIRGASKEVVFHVEGLTPAMKDQRGGERMGATATAKISRKEFGMTWNRVLEAGGVTVGDEVTITLDVEFVKRAPGPSAGGRSQ